MIKKMTDLELHAKHPDFNRYAIYTTEGPRYALNKKRCLKVFTCAHTATQEQTDQAKADAKLYADALSWKTGKYYVVYEEVMRYTRPQYCYSVRTLLSYRVHVTLHFKTNDVLFQSDNLWLTAQDLEAQGIQHQDKILDMADEDRLMRPVSSACLRGYKGQDCCLWVGRTSRGDYVWVDNDSWSFVVAFYPEIGWDYDEETNLNPAWWLINTSYCL